MKEFFENEMKVVNLADSMTEKDRNIEKLLRWASDNHVTGTYYSDEYLAEIRKIIKSPTGKYGWKLEI